MKICDLMHKGVIFCYPDDSAKDIARMMKENQIRSVVVMDETGEVWGLVSIMELLPLYNRNLDEIRAEDIMRPYQIEVDPQWSIEKAIEIMQKRKIEHLIIIDPHAGPKRPVGILTSFDIVQYMSGLKLGTYEQQLKISS